MRSALPRKRLLLLHKYGNLSASFRHRLLQYVPYLESAGFECTISPLLDDDYLGLRFRTGRRSIGGVASGVLRRIKTLGRIREFDLVIVFVELIPYLPWKLERVLLGRRVPYIYDYDDPVFHYYDLDRPWVIKRLLGSKIRNLAASAAAVSAGNQYLAEYVRGVNGRVQIFPTVVDLRRYPTTKDFHSPSRPFSIGWIGSPSTATYLRIVDATLRDFCRTHDARVILVGARNALVRDYPVEVRPWSEAREVADILDFDVGLMPLTDDPWSRGKSGFKLIQYMASGLPVIASPVGVNTELVDEGVNGFLPDTDEGWMRALTAMYEDWKLMARLGAAGRRKVEASYSLQVTAPRFVGLVEAVLNDG